MFCSKHDTNDDDSDERCDYDFGYYRDGDDLLDWSDNNNFNVWVYSDDFSDSECKSQDNEIKVNEQDFFDDVDN